MYGLEERHYVDSLLMRPTPVNATATRKPCREDMQKHLLEQEESKQKMVDVERKFLSVLAALDGYSDAADKSGLILLGTIRIRIEQINQTIKFIKDDMSRIAD